MNVPEGKIRIYFGDKDNFISKADLEGSKKALLYAREYLGAESLFLLDQVHGTDGVFIDEIKPIAPFDLPLVLSKRSASKGQDDRFLNQSSSMLNSSDYLMQSKIKIVKNNRFNLDKNTFVLNTVEGCESGFSSSNVHVISKQGDFLYTNLPMVALGILSADCLPIVVFDQIKNALLVIHAGWRGSLSGIIKVALGEFCKNLNLDLKNLLVYFGPSARSCCYEVKEDFILELKKITKNYNEFINLKDGKLYFDLTKFNLSQLLNLGILESSINLNNNECTICTLKYCSSRRMKSLHRNLTSAVIL